MEVLLALAIFVALVLFVSAPLRHRPREVDEVDAGAADLEARKQAKYAEIRDARLDHASGKLSDEDFERQDAELRGEAVAILKQLDGVDKPAESGG
jgi:hypothetical protein